VQPFVYEFFGIALGEVIVGPVPASAGNDQLARRGRLNEQDLSGHECGQAEPQDPDPGHHLALASMTMTGRRHERPEGEGRDAISAMT
jgi:hypothetical protein